ncbi:MAG: HD domain-containing phosphohydrolase [Accumulibacter sp.]|uniref:HD domain-containing phosphohydrolase n=1 Tax=Accumulibacter sp. TaxID=2053492 RepID=UPI002FC28134
MHSVLPVIRLRYRYQPIDMRRPYPLHIHISTLFLALIVGVCAVLAGIGYRLSSSLLQSSAAGLTSRISQETLLEMRLLIDPAQMATRLLSQQSVSSAGSLAQRLQSLQFLRIALDSSPALSSLYVGYDNGDFFLLGRIGHGSAGERARAPSAARYVVQSIERTTPVARGVFMYFDDELRLLRRDDRPDYAATYDPRQRPWFTQARHEARLVETPPYLFFSSQRVGTTLAHIADGGRAVVAADILLHTLGEALARQKVTPATAIAMVNGEGRVLAYEEARRMVLTPAADGEHASLARLDELGVPALVPVLDTVRNMQGRQTAMLAVSTAGQEWRASVDRLLLESPVELYIVTAIPEEELLAGALRLVRHSALATLLVLLLTVPLTWALAQAVSRSLGSLAGEAEAIRHFEFVRPIVLDSSIKEVSELAQTMDGMKRTIRRFVDISQAVAAEQDFDRLLPHLLADTMKTAGAGAGILYLAGDDKLQPAAALQHAGQVGAAGLATVGIGCSGPLLGTALAARAARSDRLRAEDHVALGLTGTEWLQFRYGIAVPLLNRNAELVGAIMLFVDGETDADRLSFVKALSASAAVSLESKALIKAQKDLFAAFIQLIAAAIDAKSPYTGGHCARVPELTQMLADAACAANSGPYRDFDLSQDDREALHVAAWLHDCGKVTTPEYVVDKATKLESIHDRIHEVRMRFEVLKRDAEIDCLRAVAGGEDAAVAESRLRAAWQQLDDDFAFVARCNEGGESMAEHDVERLRTIAARSWLRTLDDRIGIAREERLRKESGEAAALPVAEPLLADKPEHLVPRRQQDRFPENNRWGFRMRVPELLYNRGEIYNLSVGRGTLTDEERYKINEHIIQTLMMLSQLPFPKHLRQVPEIAGGHHEKMDGSGYPRQLRRDEMSPLARMMAIADIFEALTAIDRPYKTGKTLSAALAIMVRMQQEQHIDGELFALFLRAGVHLEYAREHMQPEQIDSVDVDALLARLEPPPATF